MIQTKRRILFESQDLNSKAATGVASYVKGLARAARSLGYSPAALFSSNVRLDDKDPVFRDIRLNDASQKPSLLDRAKSAINWAGGAPTGIRPVPIGSSGAVIDPARTATYSAFDQSFAALHLVGRARRTFNLYGRFADVKLDNQPDLFHAGRPVPLRVPGKPNIYTLHDIVPLRLPYASLDRKRFYYRQIKEIIRTADHLVSVSDFTKQDVCQMFGVDPSKITTTYQAVSIDQAVLGRAEEEVREELRNSYNLEYKEYFLHVGSLEPKKNVGRLVDAFAASRTKRPLVLVGALGWLYEADLEAINAERFLAYKLKDDRLLPDRRVRRLGYVRGSRVASLVRGARALLFPSIYEGFGLPVLEAMTLGTPVLTSNVSALPEVAGGAALLIDPYDIDEMSRAIDTLDADGDLRLELSARGLERAANFSEERYFARLQSVYERVLG